MNLTNRIKISTFLILGFSWFMLILTAPVKTLAGPEIPAQSMLADIIEESMLEFAIAVKAEDFTVFYRKISKLWQSQITKEQLLNEFKSFIDKNIDLTGIKELEPVLEKAPFLDNNGLLRVQGSYATKPSKTAFNLKYLMENGVWKLAGIKINMK